MQQQFTAIRDQQKQTWNKFASGWKKWDVFTMQWLQPMGEAIVDALHVTETDVILDIASGTGEPALSLAQKAAKGKVVMTDLSESMLTVAHEKAEAAGIHNVETKICDVSELPFANESFDKVSCRFGFMFFPDMQLGAKEMTRVLTPGGRLATAVWDEPHKNVWVTVIMGSISQHMQLPPSLPDAPGIFRCAKPGLMRQLLEEAGLRHITEKSITGKLDHGSFETYWQFMTEVAAPVVSALSQADNVMVETIKKDVLQKLRDKYGKDQTGIEYGAVIYSGER